MAALDGAVLEGIAALAAELKKLQEQVERGNEDQKAAVARLGERLSHALVSDVNRSPSLRPVTFPSEGTPGSDFREPPEIDRAGSSSSPSALLGGHVAKKAPTDVQGSPGSSKGRTESLYPTRIVITTYPGQVGIQPIPLQWYEADPIKRGPVVSSRHPTTLKVRNAIGAYGGSYSIYRALAIAIGDLPPNHRPDFHNTSPPIRIGPHPQWADPEKIVSLDPFGHVATDIYEDYLRSGIDLRPTIAVTKAHMHLPEIQLAVQAKKLPVDGKVVVNASGDVRVSKAAIEPVWYLPGVAKKLGVDEALLRRALFEEVGGAWPELITRPDLKVFLPPIGGVSIYIFGNPDFVSDPTKHLAVRVHDECNGSDVFGSDICTCRPYLIQGIEECVQSAQNGGAGVIIYFRKEGRALGEVVKYQFARKRAEQGDQASEYFKRTESVAGVKDSRFQALMPDVLHWLGITKIDRFISMSNMKYDALVKEGIKIITRVPIPEDMIPEDSKVEIEAKVAAGYYRAGKVPNSSDLQAVKGRTWDDVLH
ncbi:GTP cyclohydrolase II [Hyaloraphidium curvatum]|nr:GTP cyclohydrolase II [Hyaloraphidium curvatum]